MGHFTHNCKLTSLPITDSAVLIVMKPQENLWDNSEAKLKQFGKTYMCSNDGPRLKYIPCWFPIKGTYSGYGSLENIIEDDNTKILEEYYNMPISELLEIVCSGRKDDGFDEALNKIKKQVVFPEGYDEEEPHFDRYQRLMNDPMPFGNNMYPDVSLGGKKPWTVIRNGEKVPATKKEYDADFKLIHEHYERYNVWKESNPDLLDDYGKPEYEDKYKELLTYSGMWVHGDVYDQLTDKAVDDLYGNTLDLGVPAVLKSLGFTEGPVNKKKERYNIPFTKDGLTIYSDGTWINQNGNEHIYTLSHLQKYCAKKGVAIDITDINSKDRVEQIYDYVLPESKTPKTLEEELALIDSLDTANPNSLEILKNLFKTSSFELDTCDENLIRIFLNTNRYGASNIKNPLTTLYINNAREGKLRDNVVRFWRFDSYMYTCGRYYEIVGTGPQDGERKQVMKVLDTALTILKSEIKLYHDEYEDEYEDE